MIKRHQGKFDTFAFSVDDPLPRVDPGFLTQSVRIPLLGGKAKILY